MINEQFKIPLPIYDRLEKQHRFEKAEVHVKTIVSRDRIIPFQFKVNAEIAAEDITEWTIRNPDADRTVAHTLTSKVDQLEIVVTASGETYIIYKDVDIELLMSPGVYHLEFVVDGVRRYSEQFEVRCNSPYWNDIESEFIKIEWGNTCDVGPIMYQTGYRNRVYLDAKLHNETPTIEEEGDEDGDGHFIPSAQRYVDNLFFEDLLPRYLADALLLTAMHKDVMLTTPMSTYESQIFEIKPTMTQEENTWLHRFNMTFQQESQYVNGNCCENIPLPAPPTPSCNAAASNVQIFESPGGIVSITWDIVGDHDRVRLTWLTNLTPCVQGTLLYLPAGTTSYMIPDAVHPSVISVSVRPQCENGDEWIDGTVNSAGKQLILGPECNPPGPDPDPPTPSGLVVLENNTTNLPIYDVSGITGFAPPPVAPQSSYSGTHSSTIGGTVNVYFDETYSSFKHMRLYVNGDLYQCRYLSSSPTAFIIPVTPIAADADIKISIHNGDCP